jgi:hypothetical protein
VAGKPVTLSSFRNRKLVVLSFVPAAFTPVCSAQWPMYNMAEAMFKKYNTVVLGISTDNLPSQYAWTKNMGELWFPVLSDFWPTAGFAENTGCYVITVPPKEPFLSSTARDSSATSTSTISTNVPHWMLSTRPWPRFPPNRFWSGIKSDKNDIE